MGVSYKSKKTTEVGDFEDIFFPYICQMAMALSERLFTQAGSVFASTFKKFFKSQ